MYKVRIETGAEQVNYIFNTVDVQGVFLAPFVESCIPWKYAMCFTHSGQNLTHIFSSEHVISHAVAHIHQHLIKEELAVSCSVQ